MPIFHTIQFKQGLMQSKSTFYTYKSFMYILHMYICSFVSYLCLHKTVPITAIMFIITLVKCSDDLSIYGYIYNIVNLFSVYNLNVIYII